MTTTTPSAPDEVVLDETGLEAALAAFNSSINQPEMIPCPKCEGRGYHHGFGEDGASPDWCTDCGGNQFSVVPGEEQRAIASAVCAYLRASPQPAVVTEEQVEAALAFWCAKLPKAQREQPIPDKLREHMRGTLEAARLPSPTDTRERVPARPVFPHGMTEAEWNEKIGDPSYEHAKDLPDD